MIFQLIQSNSEAFSEYLANPPKAIIPEVGQTAYVVDVRNGIPIKILKATRLPDVRHVLRLIYQWAGKNDVMYLQQPYPTSVRLFTELEDAREYLAASHLLKHYNRYINTCKASESA